VAHEILGQLASSTEHRGFASDMQFVVGAGLGWSQRKGNGGVGYVGLLGVIGHVLHNLAVMSIGDREHICCVL